MESRGFSLTTGPPVKIAAHRILTIALGTALLFNARSALAQESETTPIEIGFSRTIESDVLGETRRLLISLPERYDKSEDHYPVVYVLDGDAHFPHTAAFLSFEARYGRIPPVILVGIPNTDRTRDLTPPTATEAETYPTAGGVDDFLRFLREEVIPMIARDYRASDHRTLIGHSYGGMTALHCLIHYPDDYSSYLAISPSLWWDEQRLVEQAATAFPQADRHELRLFMTLGNEDGKMLSGYRRLEALLSESPPEGLQWSSRRMPEESHLTIPYRSTVHGLLYLFQPWALPGLGATVATGGWDALDAELAVLEDRYGRTRPRDFRIVMQVSDELIASRRFEELFSLYESAPQDLAVPPVEWELLGERALTAGERDVARRAYTVALVGKPDSDSLREALRKVGGDPDAIPRPAPLDPARAARLAGTYRDQAEGATFVLEVEFADGRLFAILPNGPRAPLERDEGDRFRLFDGFIMIEFRFADGGPKPTDLIYAPQLEDQRVLVRE